jgi:hypothetical protein
LVAVAAVLYQRAAAQGFADQHARSESKTPR